MNEEVIQWVDIGRKDDIPVQGSRRIDFGDTKVAVFRTADDGVFALEDKCPHAKGRLSEGIVHGECVTCPLHNWVISLQDGSAQGADKGQVKRFKVRQKGERVLMEMESEW